MSRIWRSMSETIQLPTFTILNVVASNRCDECGGLGALVLWAKCCRLLVVDVRITSFYSRLSVTEVIAEMEKL